VSHLTDYSVALSHNGLMLVRARSALPGPRRDGSAGMRFKVPAAGVPRQSQTCQRARAAACASLRRTSG
jgi:hypothetical protein